MSQALGSDGDSWLLTKSLRAQVFMQKDLETWLRTASKTVNTEDIHKASLPTELTQPEETQGSKGKMQTTKPQHCAIRAWLAVFPGTGGTRFEHQPLVCH